MTTATKRKTAKSKKTRQPKTVDPSQAQGYGHFVWPLPSEAKCKLMIYYAQESKGRWYGSPSIEWENSVELDDLKTNLCPSASRKFDTRDDAINDARSQAFEHLQRILTNDPSELYLEHLDQATLSLRCRPLGRVTCPKAAKELEVEVGTLFCIRSHYVEAHAFDADFAELAALQVEAGEFEIVFSHDAYRATQGQTTEADFDKALEDWLQGGHDPQWGEVDTGGSMDGLADLRDDEPVQGIHGKLSPEIVEAFIQGAKEVDLKPFAKSKLSYMHGESKRAIELDFPLNQIQAHPNNRTVTQASVEAVAESMKEDGQWDAVDLRVPPKLWRIAPHHYQDSDVQLLSGETRCLAAKKLGWSTIRARLYADIDDTEAGRILARKNAQRQDLTDVDKGRHLIWATSPVKEGGLGMSLKDAAADLNISDSAASNLRRIAELPKYWTDLVASGEWPGSFLRPIATYRDSPKILELIQAAHEQDAQHEWRKDGWESRTAIEESVERLIEEATYPVEAADHQGWEAWQPLEQSAIDANADKLDLITISITREGESLKVRRALNGAAWQKLQEAKRSSEQNIKRGDPSELTPEEIKAKKARRREQLKEKRGDWLIRFKVQQVSQAIKTCERPGLVLRLVLELLAEGVGDGGRCLYTALTGKASNAFRPDFRKPLAKAFKDGQLDEVAGEFVSQVIWNSAAVAMTEQLPHLECVRGNNLDALCSTLSIDINTCWSEACYPGSDAYRLIETFFRFHESAELDALGKELGVDVKDLKRSEKITKFLESHGDENGPLPLPKCYQSKKRAK